MAIKHVFYRNPHNYDLVEASNEAAIPPDGYGESLTIQSQAEDADINVMMKRFGVTGQLPQGVRVPEYGDFTGISDFRSALEAVEAAKANFMKLLPETRQAFENNPQLFLDFCSNPANMPALVKLGLAKEIVNGREGSVAGAGGSSGGQQQASGGSAGVDSATAGGGSSVAG